MASAKTLRSEGIFVIDRIALLRAKFESLSRTERSRIKKEMELEIQPFLDRIVQILVANTTDNPESAEIMQHREDGWDKYGVQDYVLQRSPLKSERYWGISLRNAWTRPTLDFSGSGVNRIGLNIRMASIAPQAPLVFLGEYKKDSWEVPNQMHGDRRVMMWEGPDGRPVFRWAVVKGELTSPMTVNKPRSPYLKPLIVAEQAMEDFRPVIIKTIQDSLQKEFESV